MKSDFLIHWNSERAMKTLFLFLCYASTAIANTCGNSDGANDDYLSQQDCDDDDDVVQFFQESESNNEWYMMLIFSLLFGYFIILFGSVVGYFSFMEDELLRQYRQEADIVQADVVAVQFTRRGLQTVPCGSNHIKGENQSREYVVIVEYMRGLSTCSVQSMRVRKQVKVLETDFLPRTISAQSPYAPPTLHQKDTPAAQFDRQNCVLPNRSQLPSIVAPQDVSLELYVLSAFPKSGYPCRQAERACSLRYRCSTVVFLIFVLLLGAGCLSLAMDAIFAMEREDVNQTGGWMAVGFFLVLVALQVPMIHCLMNQCLWSILKEEYLESGLCESDQQGVFSSMSSGSDAFLVDAGSTSGVNAMNFGGRSPPRSPIMF